jgi:hypothetical protein
MTTDVFDLCAGRSDEYAGTHRADRFNNLNRSTVALLVNTAVTGFVGFGYWILAAHLFSKSAVGTAAALISASTLLSGLGQLNLSSTLMRFLPSARDHSARLILSAYGVAAGLSLALATAVMVTTIVFGDSGSPLHLPVWEAVLFCICVAVNSVFVRIAWAPTLDVGADREHRFRCREAWDARRRVSHRLLVFGVCVLVSAARSDSPHCQWPDVSPGVGLARSTDPHIQSDNK